jgi:hypothetical protein
MKQQRVRGERRKEPRGGGRAGRPEARDREPAGEGRVGAEPERLDPAVVDRRADPAAPAGAAAEPVLEVAEGAQTVEAAPEEPVDARPQPAAGPSRRWLAEGLVTVAQARAIERMLEPGEPGPVALERLVEAGVITRSQAGAVQRTQAGNGHALVPVTGRRPALAAAETTGSEHAVRAPRLSLDANRLGVFLASVGFAGALWAVITILAALLSTPRKPLGVDVAGALQLLGAVLVLVGGRRMFRGVQNGKPMALIGLLIFALASLLLFARRLGDPVVLGLLLAWGLLYYLTMLSRFRPTREPEPAPAPR